MKKQSIEFVKARKPVRDLVTKFGGQPVWLLEPQWPLSAETGRPMRFICQIDLTAEPFNLAEPKMAYLFMTDEEEFVDGTWEPDGGENALILQPGKVSVPVKSMAEGPTLCRWVKKLFRKYRVPVPCEYAISGAISEDPEFIPMEEREGWADEKREEYDDALEGNKLGGTPGFLQYDEFPGPGNWKLLLQLDSARVPFEINFGDAGIGYAFLLEDGSIGKFLFQCL